jgi:soluble lytic murein transglycosylase-like protein
MFAPLSLKQLRENAKFQSKEARENAKLEGDESRKQQLQNIKLQEAAAKANQGLGHKEDVHAAKMKELGSPLGKSKLPRMNKQKLGIPTQNPLAGTGVLGQGQKKLYAQGTDTVPAMLTPGEAVIPAPAAQDPKNKPLIQQMVAEGREANSEADAVKPTQEMAFADGTTRVPSMQQQMFGNIPKISSIKPARRPSKMHYYEDGTTGVNGFMDTLQQSIQKVAPFLGMLSAAAPGMAQQTVDAAAAIPDTTTPTDQLVQPVPMQMDVRIPVRTDPNQMAARGAALADNTALVNPNEVANEVTRQQARARAAQPPLVRTTGTTATGGDQSEYTGLSPQLLNAQRIVESGNRMKDSEGRYVVSPAGAIGIAQIMPKTAYNPGFGVPPLKGEEIYDEGKQIEFQGNYMKAMVDRYSGDTQKALTAYNAGAGSVDSAVAKATKAGKPEAWKTYLPTKEAKEYADKVMANMGGKGTSKPEEIIPPKTNLIQSDVPPVEATTEVATTEVPPTGEVALSEPSPMAPPEQNAAIASVAKDNVSYFDQALAAMKAANLSPEQQKEEATSLVQKIYGDKGIFNTTDLLRFAVVAAGGMLTGGSTAGALRFAAKDTLNTADRRNAERVAADRQQRSFEQQGKMSDKRFGQQLMFNEASKLDAENRAAKTLAASEKKTGIAAMVKEGVPYLEAKAYYDSDMKGPQPRPAPSFIRSGDSELVTLTQPTTIGSKTLKPGEPIYSYKEKDRVTGEVRNLFLVGDKTYSETEAAKKGIFVRKWNDNTDGSRAKVERLIKWTDESAKRMEGVFENQFGASNVKGKPNPARAGQVTSGEASVQAKSWAIAKEYDISDPRSMNELDKITLIAAQQAARDMASGAKVSDMTPYLNASYIKDKSGLDSKLFTLDPKSGKEMNPEKIAGLSTMLANNGITNQQNQAAELSRLATVWKANPQNIQKKFKDADSETAFYLFVKDALKPKSK